MVNLGINDIIVINWFNLRKVVFRMANEICPHCRALRDTVVSTYEKEIEEDGKSLKVITKNYHCSMCNSFIRCEDTKKTLIRL